MSQLFSRRSFIWITIIVIAVLAAVSVVLGSLNEARSSMTGGDVSDSGYDASTDGYTRNESTSQKSTAADYDDSASGESSYADDRQIIKTGSLELVVDTVERAADEIATIAEMHNGIVTDRNVYEAQGNKKRGNVTIKVPNEQFEVVFSETKAIATKVTRDAAQTEDVTERYIDLQAQLKNKQAVEAQYLEVLEQAWKIEDILSVQERLDRTRGEIERLQGQLTYLERRIDMSTITVQLVSESEAAVLGVVWNPLTQIKQAAYDTLESLISFFYTLIQIVFMIPIVLLWGMLVLVVLYIGKKVVRLVQKHILSDQNPH